VITNGFSCHAQIAQGADRKALHLAEVIQLALQEAGAVGVGPGAPVNPAKRDGKGVAAAIAVGATAGALALALGRKQWMASRR